MPEEPVATFRATADHRTEAVVIVAEGELDLVGGPRLISALPGEGDTPVVLDLGSVAFMDSSGLRALLEARQACLDAGRPFSLARPSDAVLRVLELVDLAREFEVLDVPPGSAS
jgi:anti-sigma B factor antagonist